MKFRRRVRELKRRQMFRNAESVLPTTNLCSGTRRISTRTVRVLYSTRTRTRSPILCSTKVRKYFRTFVPSYQFTVVCRVQRYVYSCKLSLPHVTLKTSTQARQRKSYSWSPTQHATSTSPRLRVLVRLTRVSGIPSWGCSLRERIARSVV